MTSLFDTLPPTPEAPDTFLSELPVSVIEIKKQNSGRRTVGNQSTTSSRTEYSHFPPEINTLCLEFYLRDSRSIFDPFAGWGERGKLAKDYDKNYTGFDINPNAIAAALELGVTNYLQDSLTASIPSHDALLTCPPYWNLEKYSPNGIENAKEWRQFLAWYETIIERSYDAAKTGAFYCILVGDWRHAHRYYDLTHQTRCIFDRIGATIWDEVISSRRTISKIKIMLPQAKRLGYSVKVHETLLVFQKR